MQYTSSKYIDTGLYKTLEIMKFFVSRATNGKPIVAVNKKETMFRSSCPLHTEKTPSFTIYSHDSKTTIERSHWEWGYKCFGCGRSGDIFTFLRDTEGMRMWEVLSLLRKRFPNIETNNIVHKNQLEIPFPKKRDGTFIWISPYMDDEATRNYTTKIYATKRYHK